MAEMSEILLQLKERTEEKPEVNKRILDNLIIVITQFVQILFENQTPSPENESAKNFAQK